MSGKFQWPGHEAPRLSDRALRDIEAKVENDREAHVLLDLINAEFQSDPQSVACFDLRIVERVKLCVERRKRLRPFWGEEG